MKLKYLIIVSEIIFAFILFPNELTISHIKILFASYFLYDSTYMIVSILKEKGYLDIKCKKNNRGV